MVLDRGSSNLSGRTIYLAGRLGVVAPAPALTTRTVERSEMADGSLFADESEDKTRLKRCSGCGLMKPLSDFNFKQRSRDRRQDRCRPCDGARRREWYRRPGNKARTLGYVRKQKKRLRAWFANLKLSLACEKCGEDHPAALDLHHRDPSQKDLAISAMHGSGVSQARILEEMKKCSVLCANCHRKLHFEERFGPIAQRQSGALSTRTSEFNSP